MTRRVSILVVSGSVLFIALAATFATNPIYVLYPLQVLEFTERQWMQFTQPPQDWIAIEQCAALCFPTYFGAPPLGLKLQARGNTGRTYAAWDVARPFQLVIPMSGQMPPKVRRVDVEAWRNAKIAFRPPAPPHPPPRNHKFSLAGHELETAGTQWTGDGPVLSPDGRLIALPTMSGPERLTGMQFLSPNKRWFSFYIQIYEVVSGRQFATFARKHIVSTSEPQHPTLIWANPRLLLLDLKPGSGLAYGFQSLSHFSLDEAFGGVVWLDSQTSAPDPTVRFEVDPRWGRYDITASFLAPLVGIYSFGVCAQSVDSRSCNFGRGQMNQSLPLTPGSRQLTVHFTADDIRRDGHSVHQIYLSGPDVGALWNNVPIWLNTPPSPLN